jgi:hypothetical protein
LPRTVLSSGGSGRGISNRCPQVKQFTFIPALSSGAWRTELHRGQANRIMAWALRAERCKAGLKGFYPRPLCLASKIPSTIAYAAFWRSNSKVSRMLLAGRPRLINFSC